MKTDVNKNQVKNQSAFTLAEVVVAMGIVGFLFATVFLVMVQSLAIIQSARENLRATQIIQEVTEVLRLYTWDQVTRGGFVPTSFTNYFDPTASATNHGTTYYGRIAISDPGYNVGYSNSIRQVVVSVSWTNKSVPHTKSITTLVSEYGIQNYIY